MTAPLHYASGVVAGDFHPVSDCSVAEAMACKTVSLAVVELGGSTSIPTGSRYSIVIGRCLGSCEQVTVAGETFADAGLHNLADAAPKWCVPLILCLCGFQSNEVLLPMKLIETPAGGSHSGVHLSAAATERHQPHRAQSPNVRLCVSRICGRAVG